MKKPKVKQLLLRLTPAADVRSSSEKPSRKRLRSERREKIKELSAASSSHSDQEMSNDSQDAEMQNMRSDDDAEESEDVTDVSISRKNYQKNCACKDINNSFLNRIQRKNVETSGIKTECIAALRHVIECTSQGANLQHVCHKHLHALAGHFGLQVKKLNTSALRSRLFAC
jgi:hypothetical protein